VQTLLFIERIVRSSAVTSRRNAGEQVVNVRYGFATGSSL
jgi:hypothetical protein